MVYCSVCVYHCIVSMFSVAVACLAQSGVCPVLGSYKIELDEQFMCVIVFRVILIIELEISSTNIDHKSNPSITYEFGIKTTPIWHICNIEKY